MKKLFVALTLFLGVATTLSAADWPQFRGPQRNGILDEKGLLQAWPEKGPALQWTFSDAGLGFSSFAIVGERLYTIGARKEDTYVIAIDATRGKEIWSTRVDKIFSPPSPFNQWGDGPRSTPTVDGELLYTLTGNGILVCLQTSDGKERWRVDYRKELGGEMMSNWGYSESVLVDGDRVICTPGGKDGLLVALDKKTGAVKWRCKEASYKSPYSSIIPAKIGGVQQLVQTGFLDADGMQGGVVLGVDAADGKVLWTASMFTGSRDFIAPSPVVMDNLVYTTVGDSGGCHLFEVKDGKAKDLYPFKNRKVVSNDHGGVVLVDGCIYGHAGNRGWVCQDFKTGDMKWNDKNTLPGQSGAILFADDRLYLFDDDGVAALLKPNQQQFDLVGQFQIPQKSKLAVDRPSSRSARCWTHPAIANGRLYLRDQEFIFCYDVKK